MAGGATIGLARAAPQDECASRDLEYSLSARLKLTDTPHGAGDGVFDIGPGRLVLRLTPLPGSADAFVVELVDYEMQTRFSVRSKVLFWSAQVMTDARSTAARGVAARGVLSARNLGWTTPISGYRTDGTLDCKGSGCGTSGVPAEGRSEIHFGPQPVRFARFTFASDDLSTFQMPLVTLPHTDQPRQTPHLTFAGRKVGERCVPASTH